VPVIASTARGSRELVDRQTGVTFETGDIGALAAAMDRLVDDPDAAGAMGQQGRARITAGYGLVRLLTLHEEMYAGMLAERH